MPWLIAPRNECEIWIEEDEFQAFVPDAMVSPPSQSVKFQNLLQFVEPVLFHKKMKVIRKSIMLKDS